MNKTTDTIGTLTLTKNTTDEQIKNFIQEKRRCATLYLNNPSAQILIMNALQTDEEIRMNVYFNIEEMPDIPELTEVTVDGLIHVLKIYEKTQK